MKDLRFYNKEGYPYNFIYNEDNNIYEGKLFFDENSTDTFKTLCLYTFENVPEKEIKKEIMLSHSEYYTDNGIYITKGSKKKYKIEDIKNVNKSSTFFSKWVVGTNFDVMFPIGSFINISNVDVDYNGDFVIVDNKPGAVMIFGKKNNSISYDYTADGIIKSCSKIIYCDAINDNVFKSDAKFSILNSEKNDGIFTLDNIKTYDIDYNQYILPSTVKKDAYLDLNLEFKTERPRLISSKVNMILSNDSSNQKRIVNIKFDSNFKTLNKIDTNLSLSIGSIIRIEDYADNELLRGAELTILDYDNKEYYNNLNITYIHDINKTKTFNNIFNSGRTYQYPKDDIFKYVPKNLYSYDNFIKINGIEEINIVNGEKIKISSVSASGSTNKEINLERAKNTQKEFTVVDNIPMEGYVLLQVEESVIELQNGNTFEFNKRYNSGDVILYNNIFYSSKKTFTSSNLFNIKDWYVYNNDKITKELDYYNEMTCRSSIVLQSSDTPPPETGIVCYGISNKFRLLQEILLDKNKNYDWPTTIDSLKERYSSLLDYYKIDIYFKKNGVNNELSIENYYPVGNYFNIPYLDILHNKNDRDHLYKTSAKKTFTLLSIEEKLRTEVVKPSDVNKLAKCYKNDIKFDLHRDAFNTGIEMIINDITYDCKFNTNTETTLRDFCNKNNEIASNSNIGFSYNSDILTINGDYPSISIYNLEIDVNLYSKYEILKEKFVNNTGIFLTASKLHIGSKERSLITDGFIPGMVFSTEGYTIFKNKEYVILNVTDTHMYISYSGYLYANCTNKQLKTYNSSKFTRIKDKLLTIDTREFLQTPRYLSNHPIKYRYKWTEDTEKDIFYYDFSGEQPSLVEGPIIDGKFHPELKYTGVKPLIDSEKTIFLNRKPNTDIKDINEPSQQQTIFEEIILDADISNNVSSVLPSPLEVFIGYNSEDEGVSRKTLILEEYIESEIKVKTKVKSNDISFSCKKDSTGCYIEMYNTTVKDFSFLNYGFSTEYKITLNVKNITKNHNNDIVFENYEEYDVLNVSHNIIYLNEENMVNDFVPFSTIEHTQFNTFEIEIKMVPKTLLECGIYGESEDEDFRFKANLQNLGIELDKDDVHIFKESDINDDGVDYKLLNAKRKEMLSLYPDIYNYIGSYKALINAINFFGYNDLEINEYYRNIDINSDLYEKLQKITIKKMFDNDFEGWIDNEKINKSNLFKTNLFNLTYRITDEYGNNIQMYNNNEVIKKLNSLQKWLEKNIMPLDTEFLDITGISDVRGKMLKKHVTGYNVTKYVGEYKSSCVNFYSTETKNFENNYLYTFNFYTNDGTVPKNGWSCCIRTYSKGEDGKLIEKQHFDLFKTDLEAYTFSYNKDLDPYIYIETIHYSDYGLAKVNKNLRNTIFSRDYFLINNNMHMYNYLDPNKPSPAKDGYYGYIDTGNGFYYCDEFGHMHIAYENM